ncbi:Fur family transcriptional regulator [Candidatus Frankia alpina]
MSIAGNEARSTDVDPSPWPDPGSPSPATSPSPANPVAPVAGRGNRAARGAPSRGTTVRATRQGDAVCAALAETDAFTSAQDLHALLRSRGAAVGLTTVYRHLQVLVDRGEVDMIRRDDGETVYRRCATEAHHHHLVCRVCGRTVEIAGPEIEVWTAAVADAEGFVDVEHTVEIYGTCAGCATAPAVP